MLLLLKFAAIISIIVGLSYAALYVLGNSVVPDKREIIITLPPPKPLP